jgi:hypothetical protein
MTPDQLSAIRARLDKATPGPWASEPCAPTVYIKAGGRDYIAELMGPWDDARWEQRWKSDAALIANAPTDLRALLDEVERLTNELDVSDSDDRLAVKRLTAEVERLNAERDDAFRRGAEAMRESAAQRCEVSPIHGKRTTTAWRYADAIRATPIPKDEP